MTEALVFRRVRALDPAGALDAEVDVVIEGGRITRVGADAAHDLLGAAPDRVRVVERPGAWLLPGLVDLHAHLREPGGEDKEDIASGLAPPPRAGSPTCAACPTPARSTTRASITEMLVAQGARRWAASRLHPIGAITVGPEGRAAHRDGGPERRAAPWRVSDDGRCVTSQRTSCAARSSTRAPSTSPSSSTPRTTPSPRARRCTRAPSPRGSGLRGWPRVAEDIIVARDVLLAEYTGRALPRRPRLHARVGAPPARGASPAASRSRPR